MAVTTMSHRYLGILLCLSFAARNRNKEAANPQLRHKLVTRNGGTFAPLRACALGLHINCLNFMHAAGINA